MNLSNDQTVKNLEIGDTIYNKGVMFNITEQIEKGTAFEIVKIADEYIIAKSKHGKCKIYLAQQGILFTTKEPTRYEKT